MPHLGLNLFELKNEYLIIQSKKIVNTVNVWCSSTLALRRSKFENKAEHLNWVRIRQCIHVLSFVKHKKQEFQKWGTGHPCLSRASAPGIPTDIVAQFLRKIIFKDHCCQDFFSYFLRIPFLLASILVFFIFQSRKVANLEKGKKVSF